MAAEDISAQVTGWALDEAGKQCFGEDFGIAVTLGPAAVQSPQGPVQVPMWSLLITARNPVLGEGPLFHGPVPLGVARPAQADVRKQVADGLRALRDLGRSKLGALNGQPKALPR